MVLIALFEQVRIVLASLVKNELSVRTLTCFSPLCLLCRTKLHCVCSTKVKATRQVVAARSEAHQSRRQALSFAAAALVAAIPLAANADLTEDLLAKTAANKDLNDKKRLATSYSNFARSRTVSDNTCKFPNNVLGCDVGEYAGEVSYIADDAKLECEGKEAGKCNSNVNIPVSN